MSMITIAARASAVLAATAFVLDSSGAAAQELKYKLHHWSNPRAIESEAIMYPWVEAIKKASNGRFVIDIYPGMQLGGKAADLIPQVIDGVVELVYTLPGYHAGRFSILEGLELPFVGQGGQPLTAAAWEFVAKHGMSEFKDFKLISLSGIDPGLVQTAKTPVRKLEDMNGLKIRAASRYIGLAVSAFGGTPVQMPLTNVYEAMARGQVQGMMMPWVITIPFKLQDVTQYYTEIPVYTSMLLIVMNNNAYAKLPADMKKVIDDNIGVQFGISYAKVWDDRAAGARDIAIKAGKEMIALDEKEQARWRQAGKAAHVEWIKEMNGKGLNGKQMLDDLLAMVDKHTKAMKSGSRIN